MSGPDTFDDTSADHEQFEAELVAHGQDAVRAATADLVDAGIVTPVAEERMLVHEPSGEAFDSITQLAVFHRGWTAACEASEEDS